MLTKKLQKAAVNANSVGGNPLNNSFGGKSFSAAPTTTTSAEDRIAALEAALHKIDKEKESKEKKENDWWSTLVKGIRTTVLLALIALSAYYTIQLSLDWVAFGRKPASQLTLNDVEQVEMPTAGMIPAPYATDRNCFYPTFGTCRAFYDNNATKAPIDCAGWIANTTAGLRGDAGPMIIWSIDGTRATNSGFTFTSILDYVEYSFEFSELCTQPYLWVYVTADQRVVTEAKLDPTKAMSDFAQSSFLVQGGQYVMVAFNVQQEIALDGVVANTTVLSASSMFPAWFPANKDNLRAPRIATVVFRPGSLKILTDTVMPGESIIQLISSIGGWIGIFLGLSFFSLIDMIDTMYRYLEERRENNLRRLGKMQAVKAISAMGWGSKPASHGGIPNDSISRLATVAEKEEEMEEGGFQLGYPQGESDTKKSPEGETEHLDPFSISDEVEPQPAALPQLQLLH